MQAQRLVDFASFLLRLSMGLLMLIGHGLPKWPNALTALQGGEVTFPTVWGLSPALGIVLTVFAEVLCAGLLIVGLRSRIAVIPLIITMAIAAFVVHGDDPVFMMNANGGGSKEMALLFLVPFVAILILGSGRYSIDGLLRR